MQQISNSMIKTILCDLGNVIVFFNNKNIVEGLANHSNKNKTFIKNYLYNSKIRKDFSKGKTSPKQFFIESKDKLNLKINFHQFKKIWQSTFTGLNKDMVMLLNRLKKNHKIILLSNTNAIHFPYITKKYRIIGIFDGLILSYKAGYCKPDPSIYLHAIKKAKTLPNKILYIDDIYNYVQAAKSFGIKSIQYKTFEKLKTDLKRMNVKTR